MVTGLDSGVSPVGKLLFCVKVLYAHSLSFCISACILLYIYIYICGIIFSSCQELRKTFRSKRFLKTKNIP